MQPAAAELEWCHSPAELRPGELRVFDLPVMQAWEASYVEALARAASESGGAVLEVGYGLGVATALIQANPAVSNHLVVECHPDIAVQCIATWRESLATQRMHVIIGLWHQVAPKLPASAFDGILYSTYALPPGEGCAGELAFFPEAFRLLRPGGIFTYYADHPNRLTAAHRERLDQAGFTMEHVREVVCAVEPPPDCGYWQASTIVAPIVRKHE